MTQGTQFFHCELTKMGKTCIYLSSFYNFEERDCLNIRKWRAKSEHIGKNESNITGFLKSAAFPLLKSYS